MSVNDRKSCDFNAQVLVSKHLNLISKIPMRNTLRLIFVLLLEKQNMFKAFPVTLEAHVAMINEFFFCACIKILKNSLMLAFFVARDDCFFLYNFEMFNLEKLERNH